MYIATLNAREVKVKVIQLCLTLCNPWTMQSMEFSRPEYWSDFKVVGTMLVGGYYAENFTYQKQIEDGYTKVEL